MSFNAKKNKANIQIIKGVPLALLFHMMVSFTWTFGVYIGYALTKANGCFVPPSLGVLDTGGPDLHASVGFYNVVYIGMFQFGWISIDLYIYFRYGKQNFYQFLKLVIILCLVHAIVYVVCPFYDDKLAKEDGSFAITCFSALPSFHVSNCGLGLMGLIMGIMNNKQRKITWLDIFGLTLACLFALGVIPIIMLTHAHYIIDAIISISICAALFVFGLCTTGRHVNKNVKPISRLQNAMDISFANKFHLDNNKTRITRKDILGGVLLYFILVCIYIVLIISVTRGMNIFVTV